MADLPTSGPIKPEDDIEKVAEATLASTLPPETEPYSISFDKYIMSDCRVNSLDGIQAHSVIKLIRDVGINFKGAGTYMSSEILEVIPIHRNSERAVNEYAIYYKGLENDDAEIFEIKVDKCINRQNPSTNKKESVPINYRIFCYLTPADRTFHIRSINDDHKTIRNKIRFYK